MFGFSASTKSAKHPNKTSLSEFGQNHFIGATAAPYLKKQGLAEDALDSWGWASDESSADKVAAAILEWASDNGASVFCHWFQPLAASGLRHGQSGMVQNSMFEFDKMNRPVWKFTGKDLIRGETDGSSYPNGGMRQTHRAGAYLTVDPSSPIFLRGDTIFIPACMTSFNCHALDEKTPLLRANDALSKEGTRLLKLLGYKTKSLMTMIGLEQEFFFVPRAAYNKRPDLQLCGRTVTGRLGARGQDMNDHYMAPPSFASPALACMQDIQHECFKMGIPLCTRHREVAPNQYEFAPQFGPVSSQVDQNVMVMQLIDEVSGRHGLAALMQEKPFAGVNGSGKHNNWSINTDDGTNLLDAKQLADKSGSGDIFPVIMAAIIKAIHDHGDLMRMSIATPGNDFRLGACEAPPSIISTYLGETLTKYLEAYKKGDDGHKYDPEKKTTDLGAECLPKLSLPAEDRNRTSPLAYGGGRFEFRLVGSSQNVSLVDTVLATIVASTFKIFADEIESGKKPKDVAAEALESSWKVIFNGDNYDEDEQKKLTDAGVWRIDSAIDAICRYSEQKNIDLFSSMHVFTGEECEAREQILLNQYAGVVEMEAKCLVDMIHQHIIPSVKAAQLEGDHVKKLQEGAKLIKSKIDQIDEMKDLRKKATAARTLRMETMEEVRKICDDVEGIVPANLWTLATYKELLFLPTTEEC